MYNLLTILKAILHYIRGVNDYVVEEGTSGIFNYRKWNSGKMEVWGAWRGTVTNYTSFSVFSGYATTITLPTVCQFISTPQLNYNTQVGSGFAMPGSGTIGVSTTQFNAYAVSNVSGSATFTVLFQLRGHWK